IGRRSEPQANSKPAPLNSKTRPPFPRVSTGLHSHEGRPGARDLIFGIFPARALSDLEFGISLKFGVFPVLHLAKLWTNSSGVTVAVPILPTTMPAAWLERIAASSGDAPAAMASVNEAMAVSPAPDTSKTSWATVGM